jgi:hypothetical protein
MSIFFFTRHKHVSSHTAAIITNDLRSAFRIDFTIEGWLVRKISNLDDHISKMSEYRKFKLTIKKDKYNELWEKIKIFLLLNKNKKYDYKESNCHNNMNKLIQEISFFCKEEWLCVQQIIHENDVKYQLCVDEFKNETTSILTEI